MARKGKSIAGNFGSYRNYDEKGKQTGKSIPNAFGGYTTYDSKGRKTGKSVPGAFGSYIHYDARGNRTGKSVPGSMGSYVHYDKNGKKTGRTDPGTMGSYHHNDDPEGCYIATCIYGSYDCPEVLRLRRFRDEILKKTAAGRGFIRAYYAVSPRLVRRFGKSRIFRSFWKSVLDRLIMLLDH